MLLLTEAQRGGRWTARCVCVCVYVVSAPRGGLVAVVGVAVVVVMVGIAAHAAHHHVVVEADAIERHAAGGEPTLVGVHHVGALRADVGAQEAVVGEDR